LAGTWDAPLGLIEGVKRLYPKIKMLALEGPLLMSAAALSLPELMNPAPAAAREERKERRPNFQFINSSFAGLLRGLEIRNTDSDVKTKRAACLQANGACLSKANDLVGTGEQPHAAAKPWALR
jgi:hypothetical protein